MAQTRNQFRIRDLVAAKTFQKKYWGYQKTHIECQCGGDIFKSDFLELIQDLHTVSESYQDLTLVIERKKIIFATGGQSSDFKKTDTDCIAL